MYRWYWLTLSVCQHMGLHRHVLIVIMHCLRERNHFLISGATEPTLNRPFLPVLISIIHFICTFYLCAPPTKRIARFSKIISDCTTAYLNNTLLTSTINKMCTSRHGGLCCSKLSLLYLSKLIKNIKFLIDLN